MRSIAFSTRPDCSVGVAAPAPQAPPLIRTSFRFYDRYWRWDRAARAGAIHIKHRRRSSRMAHPQPAVSTCDAQSTLDAQP